MADSTFKNYNGEIDNRMEKLAQQVETVLDRQKKMDDKVSEIRSCLLGNVAEGTNGLIAAVGRNTKFRELAEKLNTAGSKAWRGVIPTIVGGIIGGSIVIIFKSLF